MARFIHMRDPTVLSGFNLSVTDPRVPKLQKANDRIWHGEVRLRLRIVQERARVIRSRRDPKQGGLHGPSRDLKRLNEKSADGHCDSDRNKEHFDVLAPGRGWIR